MGYKYDESFIISVGIELFRKRGYHAVGISEILKACNIPKGSFYNFFRSKEDFAIQTINQYGQQQLAFMQASLRSDEPSPLKRLRNFYTKILAANDEEECRAGCLVNNLSVELGGQNENIANALDRTFTTWVEELSSCVAAAQLANEISNAMPANKIAEYLQMSMYGALSRVKMTRSREILEQWYESTFRFISIPPAK